MKTFMETALDAIRNAVNLRYGGNLSAAASAWAIPLATLHSWIGDGKKRKTPQLKSIAPLLDMLNVEIALPEQKTVIKNIGSGAYAKEVECDLSLPAVPVIGEAGAGKEIENFFDLTDDFQITVPPLYYRKGVKAFRVRGDSMEPRIPSGSYVGVVPFDGNLQEGGVYLVYLPPFGHVIKKVYMNEQGKIILVSENPAYGRRVIPYEGFDSIIQGSVVWVLQKCNED